VRKKGEARLEVGRISCRESEREDVVEKEGGWEAIPRKASMRGAGNSCSSIIWTDQDWRIVMGSFEQMKKKVEKREKANTKGSTVAAERGRAV
jgi:hypothetical protein